MVRLLVKPGADKDATDNDGWTVLSRAAFSDNEVLVMVRQLAELGADKDAPDNDG